MLFFGVNFPLASKGRSTPTVNLYRPCILYKLTTTRRNFKFNTQLITHRYTLL